MDRGGTAVPSSRCSAVASAQPDDPSGNKGTVRIHEGDGNRAAGPSQLADRYAVVPEGTITYP